MQIEPMKALSLWQPWASLWACGAKKYETRSWATKYRGPIAIHAGKQCYGPYACELPIGFTDAAANAFWPGETDPCVICDGWDELPRGEIIATAEPVNIWRICYHPGADVDRAMGIPVGAESMTLDKHHPDFNKVIIPSEQELLFGDWTPVRYAWEITNVKMLDKPIPCKGHQGLWNWEGVA